MLFRSLSGTARILKIVDTKIDFEDLYEVEVQEVGREFDRSCQNP